MHQTHITDDITTSFGDNSWYLCRPLSQCRSLFSKMELGYFAHAFKCKCSTEKIYISNTNQRPIHICLSCNNRQFLDEKNYANTYATLLAKIDRPIVFELTKQHGRAILSFLKPVGIDLSRDCIDYLAEEAYTLEVSLTTGKYSPKFSYLLCDDADKYAQNALVSYLTDSYLKRKIKNYHSLYDDTCNPAQKKEQLDFFLLHSYIHDAQMYYWDMPQGLHSILKEQSGTKSRFEFLMHHRNEPSVKRAFYERYLIQIEQKYFDPVTPYIICRAFKDPNIVCTLLRKTSLRLSNGSDINIFTSLMDFLKTLEILQTYYSQKSIISMFLDPSFDALYWEDVMRMLQLQKNTGILETYFQKPRCRLMAIHDKLAQNEQIRKNVMKNLPFRYNTFWYSATGLWHSKFECKLPKDTNTLCLWGEVLQNCLCSYADAVTEGKSFIYGIFIHSKLAYAIELNNTYNIIQVSGFKNKIPPQKILTQIRAWHKRYFISSS